MKPTTIAYIVLAGGLLFNVWEYVNERQQLAAGVITTDQQLTFMDRLLAPAGLAMIGAAAFIAYKKIA